MRVSTPGDARCDADAPGASGDDGVDIRSTPALPGSPLAKAVVALVGVAGLAWGYQFGAQLSGPWLGVATALGSGLFGVLLADSAVDALTRAADRRGSAPR